MSQEQLSQLSDTALLQLGDRYQERLQRAAECGQWNVVRGLEGELQAVEAEIDRREGRGQ